MTKIGLPKVTGYVMTTYAQIRTLMPAVTHASSRWKTSSPPARSLRPPRSRSSLKTNPKMADRVGQREQGQEQLILSRKLSPTRTNKEHITRLSNARYHVTTILPPVYTCMQPEYSRK
jgi:hypothetical protein